MAPTSSHDCDCVSERPSVVFVYDDTWSHRSDLEKAEEEIARLKKQLARVQHELFQARNRGNRR